MSQIDWSKAPNGATHFLPAGNKYCCDTFILVDSGKVLKVGYPGYGWAFTYTGDSQPNIEMWRAISRMSDTLEWTGEGLPPVGTVCEIAPDCKACQWCVGEILATGPVWFAASFSGDHTVLKIAGYKFRPIRTPEQIAAEERQHKIRNAHTDIARTLDAFKGSMGATACRQIIEAMIDAGYKRES